METCLEGTKGKVTISSGGPCVIIGEKINPTGRKRLAAALQSGDLDSIRQLAVSQVQAGADVLDVNVGAPGVDEVVVLPQVVRLIAEAVDVPLCLDSSNRQALAAALLVAPGRPLVNSVTGEEANLANLLPLIKDRGAAVIGLAMDENGIPGDPQTRLAIAGRILERAAKIGIPPEDVIIDPLVLTVGADSQAAAVTLQTIELVRREFGVNINLGASNVSFGLPDRDTINQAFLALAMGAGATCAITDPQRLAGVVRAADLLLGRDAYARRYITLYRSRQARTPH